jgi:hypothetical protein
MAADTTAILRFAPMAITAMLPTPARPTDITAHRGLAVASLSAPVPGSVAATGMATATAGFTAIAAGIMDARVMATDAPVMVDAPVIVAATAERTRLEADSPAGFTATSAAEVSMAVAAEVSTVAAATAVDTGKAFAH